ncbi:MAG TPA: Stk1 family PASTA domain-containing Ser/Thr kinase [Microbacteriaceae bacterium]|nr:Stk1 family PASTA domain-containing Ser/Thr kinase [Microbacteriaceae bacterium]HQZ47142.1 Stk1 family PASTA domain-containing Ser/Thr kinase [Microbacteriaceae bacterium]
MTSEPRVLSGRYRIDELIGRGGMATVYRGYDLTLGRAVAVKLLRRNLADDSTFRTRFRLEAQAASRMANPTIVRVYDAGEDSEVDPSGTVHPVPYIVMELVHGELLKDIIADGPVPLTDALRYTDGILEALEYSHRAGVVHRDIKPGNVMVTPEGQIKVMDFGIARAVSDSSTTVAETTNIIGTAAYFSPEQAKGEAVDARADLYSTGVVLYELLTGRPPFRGETPVAVAYQHVSEQPATPSELNEDLPRTLDLVALRALAKDPFQRFQTAAEFRAALDAANDGREPSKQELGALTNELYGASPRQAAETARTLRQLSTDTTMKRTQSGPPVAWIWAGVAVLAVILVSVLIWVVNIQPGGDVAPAGKAVPDLINVAYDRAEAALDDLGLVAKRVDEPNGDITEGNVTRTDPAAGTVMAAGQVVTVFVSTGMEQSEVPDLNGKSEADARAAIEAAGLKVGAVNSANNASLEAGVVISASPAAGSIVAKGSTVSLVVATGRVVLINYVGFTVDAAKAQLEAPDSQLIVLTQEDPNCAAQTPAIVSQQSLSPGEAPVHAEITLTFCTGS